MTNRNPLAASVKNALMLGIAGTAAFSGQVFA